MPKTMPIAFAGAPLDLAEYQRSAEQLKSFANAKNARAIIMHHGQFLTKDGKLVSAQPMSIVGKHLYDPGPLFLGLDGKKPVFAFSFAKPDEAQAFKLGAQLEPLRALALSLPARELALAGRAKSLFDWHRDHKFCAACGNQSEPRNGGVTRQCSSCETNHFPRVNPVVIMLVQKGDKCLLGRGNEWPDGAYSCLAGFVSSGESLEEACMREVFEETGVDVHSPAYKFSQPWPYPGQIMIGLFCEAKKTKITLDTNELADARWFSKETVRGVFAGTDDSFGQLPPFTIAYQLLKHWIHT